MMLLRNANTGQIIATRMGRAATFVERAVGLIGRPNLRPDEGIWLDKCSAIHTVGMRSAIDVIFLDGEQRVVRVCPGVATFRWAVVCPQARSVVELGPGALELTDVLVGDRLELLDYPADAVYRAVGAPTPSR
jgi:uncharacterized membrane protein (UPF0127 family)